MAGSESWRRRLGAGPPADGPRRRCRPVEGRGPWRPESEDRPHARRHVAGIDDPQGVSLVLESTMPLAHQIRVPGEGVGEIGRDRDQATDRREGHGGLDGVARGLRNHRAIGAFESDGIVKLGFLIDAAVRPDVGRDRQPVPFEEGEGASVPGGRGIGHICRPRLPAMRRQHPNSNARKGHQRRRRDTPDRRVRWAHRGAAGGRRAG